MFDGTTRLAKFDWGKPVSNHPFWRVQAGAGMIFAVLIFVAAARSRRAGTGSIAAPVGMWLAVAAMAAAGGGLIALAIERMAYESLYVSGWLHSAILVALAIVVPPLAAIALMCGTGMASFGQVLTRSDGPAVSWPALCLGFAAVVVSVLAIEIALGLVFDPRYRDFPYSPLTAAIVPIVLVAVILPGSGGYRRAERIAGGALVLPSVYIAFNESFVNWQSLWLCALILALGAIFFGRRAGPRQADDQQSGCKPGQNRVVKHDTEGGCGERDREQE